MKKILFWFRNARPTALPQSLLPAALAFCMASNVDGFSLLLGVVAVIGVIAVHLGMNLLDDYFDYKVKGAEYRDRMQHRGMRARISKCPYLKSGQATMSQLLVACTVFGGIALAAGTVIYLFRGNMILLIAGLTALLGVSYSGAPLRLSYHGLGEILIGIMFGPMLMAGVYYSACGTLDYPVFFISIPVGLLVANIVYTHSIMDFEPDREVGKRTLAVLLNNKKKMLACLLALLLTAFGLVTGGVASGYLSVYHLFTLLLLPMAAGLFYLMIEFVRNPSRTFTPRFWMGYMGDWERIRSIGIDWFMIRWLIARNLLAFFCLILIIISLL
ncbi:MAG: prenyltransferase [Tannerella sp.]|jgi:1,4-dihydroxy-2-naphthoate octaprenyltransferase|nr:prenyltransferase [Tannerella sp.]